MFGWEDRKYVNPRKRIFKNMDTNEILNLEIQDDPDNIEKESKTPINAHNLKQSQQELLDDMSKTYQGTNITANTVEGYGRINKLWGKTEEIGSGEKSPTNPYTLKGVGFLLELSRTDLELGATHGETGALITNNTRLRTKNLILLEKGTYTIVYDENYIVAVQQSDVNDNYIAEIVSWGTEASFTLTEKSKIRLLIAKTDASDLSNVSSINIQIARPIEVISQNGDKQSSNIVVTKSLCCLKDGDKVIAQDYIDYTRGVVHRECGYVVLDGSDDEGWNLKSATGDMVLFWINAIYPTACEITGSISNSFNVIASDSFSEGISPYTISGKAGLNFNILSSRLSENTANRIKKLSKSQSVNSNIKTSHSA